MAREDAPKKVAKKKVAKKVAPKKRATRAIVKRAPAKKTAKKTVVRKAPLVTKKPVKQNSSASKVLLGIVVLVFVVVGGSVAVGMSDSGEINIGEVVAERNMKAVDAGEEAITNITIPKADTVVRPNGGLSGKGKSVAPVAIIPEVASTTASTTDEVASSTEPVSDEVPAKEAKEEIDDVETTTSSTTPGDLEVS